MTYGICQIISAGVNKNGKPLPHLEIRMLRARDLLIKESVVSTIQTGNMVGSLADDMRNYLEKELYIPPENLEIFYDGIGTAGELLQGRKKVEEMVAKGQIQDPYFYVVTTDWAFDRTELISDWVLKHYPHEVIGAPDGRIEWVIKKKDRMISSGEITESLAKNWVKKVTKDVERDASFETVKYDVYKKIISKFPELTEDVRLKRWEAIYSLPYPRLALAYGLEFAKKLTGKKVYRVYDDIYS